MRYKETERQMTHRTQGSTLRSANSL